MRHEGEDGELQPKVVRRGRPPSKNLKKSEESSPLPSKNPKMSVENSPIDCIGPELSSGATLASGEEKAGGSNSYNLRKGPMLHKFRSVDISSAYRSRNNETYSEWLVDWNNEFPGLYLTLFHLSAISFFGFFYFVEKVDYFVMYSFHFEG